MNTQTKSLHIKEISHSLANNRSEKIQQSARRTEVTTKKSSLPQEQKIALSKKLKTI